MFGGVGLLTPLTSGESDRSTPAAQALALAWPSATIIATAASRTGVCPFHVAHSTVR